MAIQEFNSYNQKIKKNQNNSRLGRSNHLCSTINTKTASLSSISTKKKPVSVTMISRININIKQNQYVYRKHRINVSIEKMKT